MLRIGNVQLKTNLLLAPIAGHCDIAFRLTARACGGVGLAFTDLLCPHGVLKQNVQTRWLMATNDDDKPLGMQLYGNHLEIMGEAAEWAVKAGATTIDINMGCPVDKVTKTFAGAMMLCTPDHTVRVVEMLVKTVGDRVPVTAKTRLGFDHGDLTAPALARRLVNAGIQCLTIHGRTAAMRFKGEANLDGIAAVVQAVHEAGGGKIPCIGNGDIRTPFDAAHMIDYTKCDGVMIARAALGAPWIFHDTHELLTTGRITGEYSLRQRLGFIQLHYRHLKTLREPRWAVNRVRQVIGGYGTHLGPCRPLKDQIQKMTPLDVDRFDEVCERWLETMGGAADEVPVTWAQRREQLQYSGDAAKIEQDENTAAA
jgi:tRNA-dihydrouridine synthase B